MKTNQKFRVHLLGPDDLHDEKDELSALREANEINTEIASLRASGKLYPWCMAVVEKCKN